MPGIHQQLSKRDSPLITHTCCSLWLLPPSDSPIHYILSDLIATKIPSRFPNLHNVVFKPHITLTSDITLPLDINGSKQAQKWLDDLPLPESIDLDVHFESLDVAAQYFKKITLSVKKGPVETFGAHVRSTAVENGGMVEAASWAKGTWAPHVSLMYADIEVTANKYKEILQIVIEAGILMGKEQTLLEDTNGGYRGWHGGHIALVETWKDLRDWEIVASRAI